MYICFMKIINNINIDFKSEYTRVYELTIICKNDEELSFVFAQFQNKKYKKYYTIDSFEDLEINVISQSYYHDTKKEFIKEVKKIVKKDKNN
mgnify:CR=1 FL=1